MTTVKIKQFKNRAKEPVAGLTPEHAVYDANGVRLDAKLGNINLQEFRDLQQQCVNNIKQQQDTTETYINNKVASAKTEIDAKHNEVAQLSQASLVGTTNTTGLSGNNVQENLNDAGTKLSELEKEINGNINIGALQVYEGSINGSNLWNTYAGTHIYIPLKANEEITITANSSSASRFALLTSPEYNPINDSSPSFINGESRKSVNAGQSRSIIASSDCCLFVEAGDALPSKVVTSESLKRDIEDVRLVTVSNKSAITNLETSTYANSPSLALSGKDNTVSWSESKKVIPNHKYRVFVINTDVAMPSSVSGYRLVMTTAKSFDNILYSFGATEELLPYFDIMIPNGVETVYFGARCASGSTLKLAYIDITKVVSQNFTDTFSISGYLDKSGVVATNSNFVTTDYLRIDKVVGDIEYACYYKEATTSQYPTGGGILCYDKYKRRIGQHVGNIYNKNVTTSGKVSLSELPEGTVYIRLTKCKDFDAYITGIPHSNAVSEIGFWFEPNDMNYSASFIETTATDDVDSAISIMHQLGGGVIRLTNGTFTGKIIVIRFSDVDVCGTSSSTVLQSSSYNKCEISVNEDITEAKLANMTVNHIDHTINTKLTLNNVTVQGTSYTVDDFTPYAYIASGDSLNIYKDKAMYIIQNTENAASIINRELAKKKKVILAEGVYNNTSVVTIVNDGTTFIGDGGYAFLTKSSGNAFTSTAKDVVIENIKTNVGVSVAGVGTNACATIKNCMLYGDVLIKNLTLGKEGLTDVTLGEDINNLHIARTLLTTQKPNDSVKYRLLVKGKFIHNATFNVLWDDTLDIVGITNDAEIEVNGDFASSGIVFRDGADKNTINRSHVSNIKFTRTGMADGWQYACVDVQANGMRFENCRFEMLMCSNSAYNPADDLVNVATNGDRKHGCLVNTSQDTETVFVNCVGIGSPYAHKNCRGFYVLSGNPKFYDCIGIGGGIGIYGHGWVIHGSSKPHMFNCIGIGSPYGYQWCDGIRFQSTNCAKVVGCIGYGSKGHRYTCSGGTNMVKTNEITGESRGFAFNYGVSPELIGCFGYAGDGENSPCLQFENWCYPTITNCHFGKDTRIKEMSYAKGMTVDIGNDDRNVELIQIVVRNLLNMGEGEQIVVKYGDTEICRATENTQEQHPELLVTDIPANAVVKCVVLDVNGNESTNTTIQFSLFVKSRTANEISCAKLLLHSHPHILNSTFIGDSHTNGVTIDTDGNYMIEGCSFHIKQGKTAIISRPTNSAHFYNCFFGSSVTEGVNGFAAVDNKGSNSFAT